MATNTTTINTISKTYAELKALRESSSLVPGQYYKITDFQTMWWNQVLYNTPGSVVLTSSTVEPLNVLAIATNKFSTIASSDLYPQDIIYYNFEATQNDNMLYAVAIANFKGWITRRTDTIKNIDIPIDWRHVTTNCCKPNLSSISEWNSSTTYSLWDVVKINNKLYYSTLNNNTNNNPVSNPAYINMPTVYWRPISGYREGLTYFPTDESFGFYAYKPDGSYLVNVPADTSTRIQKYMFGTNPESSNNSNDLTNYSNIKVEGVGCFSNIFCGASKNLKFGGEFYFNLLREMDAVTAENIFRFNVLDANSNNNFGGGVEHNRSTRDISHGSFTFSNNVFINETVGNIFLGGTTSNVFGITTNYNHFGSTTRGNAIGNSCYGNFFPSQQVRYNTLASFFYNNFIHTNSSFEGNVTLGDCHDNILGSSANNLIGSNFRNNNIGTSFNNNKIGADFFLNNIGHSFSYNDIGEYNNYSTIGNYFRRNTVKTAGIGSQNFTSSTLVYNEFDKTIFTNQSGQYKLSYYNSSDVQIITSPTA